MLSSQVLNFNTIRTNRHYIKSRSPKYDVVKNNALKYGVRSKHLVLPWENKADYDALLAALIAEYNPVGPTEEFYVQEIATYIWRKGRIIHAESSSLQSALNRIIGINGQFGSHPAKDALLDNNSVSVMDYDVKKAIMTTEEENQLELTELKELLSHCIKAEKIILESNSYDQGLDSLHIDDQTKWHETLDKRQDEWISENAEDLLSWVSELKADYEARINEVENRYQVKQQTLGKAYLTNDSYDKNFKYEVGFSRQLERSIAMLLKLQEMRKNNNYQSKVNN